ncbi:hypothetical protein JST97_15015 [bacterium]|nr:hypothetical protein [bacterium]
MIRRTLGFICLAGLGALCDQAMHAVLWPLSSPSLVGRVGQDLIMAQASPDGSRVAGLQRLGPERWTLTVWDTQSKRELISSRPITHPPATTSALAWSSDSQWLAVGSAGEVGLWEVARARQRVLKSEYLVREVRFSGDWLLGRSDNALFVWSWKDGRLLRRIAQDHVLTAALSQEAGVLAAASLQDSIRLYSLPAGKPLRTLPAGPATINLEFVAGGERLASGFRFREDRSKDCSILYKWRQGQAEARVSESDLVGFSVSQDGQRLLTRNPGGGHIWDNQGRCLQEFQLPGLLTDSLSSDGSRVASLNPHANQVVVWKSLTEGQQITLPTPGAPYKFGFLGGGRVQVVDGACSVYQLP